MRRARLITTVLLSSSLLLVGCGGGSDSSDGETDAAAQQVEGSQEVTATWPMTGLPVKLYAQYTYFSERYSNANDVNVTLYPEYYVINGGVLWDISEKLSLQLHVANLTNQLTFTEGDPLFFDLKAPDGVGNRGVARPLFGRTYRAFLNYRF